METFCLLRVLIKFCWYPNGFYTSTAPFPGCQQLWLTLVNLGAKPDCRLTLLAILRDGFFFLFHFLEGFLRKA